MGRSREAGNEDVALDQWYEVVGVVPDFPVRTSGRRACTGSTTERRRERCIRRYCRCACAAVRRRPLPARSGSQRRSRSELQLHEVSSFDEALKREQGIMRIIGVTIALTMLSVMVLSAAGIYSLMSFTVARRRREIGIRAALGADPARMLLGIISRAFAQLGAGAAVGMAVRSDSSSCWKARCSRDRAPSSCRSSPCS